MGLSGREAHVLHAASGATSRAVLTVARDYDDAEWEAMVARLAARGVLTPEGAMTAAGQALKDEVERRTDELALAAYDVLDDDELAQLIDTAGPVAKAVVAAGDLPDISPIGPLAAQLR